NRIIARMQAIFTMSTLTAANVRFQYQYVSMGYVGGPAVPLVTVTLTGVQFKTGFLSIIGSGINSNVAKGNNASVYSLHVRTLNTIPDISARFTGEDLNDNPPS